MQWKEQGGFTLLEVLIAIVLLALGVLSALTVETACIRGNSSAARMDDATGHAQVKLEELRSVKNPVSLANGTDAPNGYVRAWVITPHATVSGARWIQVSVSWTGGFGNQQVNLQGLATGDGL